MYINWSPAPPPAFKTGSTPLLPEACQRVHAWAYVGTRTNVHAASNINCNIETCTHLHAHVRTVGNTFAKHELHEYVGLEHGSNVDTVNS